jgi:hypothetical protein
LSFIEKHKIWLLPLLGLGVLGVGYMNFRTIQSGPHPTESALAKPEAAPPEEVPAAVSGTEDLWSDLRPFAILPGSLAQEDVLTDRARLALGAELDLDGSLSLGRPAWTSLTMPMVKPGGQGPTLGPTGEAAPELDFLIHGPHGSYAWFGGRAYQTGAKLLDSSYTLSRIGSTFVELTGPQGRIVVSTNPIHAFGQNPPETP